MRRFCSLVLSGLGAVLPAASSASANDYCEDLWFTRNAIMDRAGYCFGSNLGKAVFDNSDCIGKTVEISPTDQRVVAHIQNAERDADCRIDTSNRQLSLRDLHRRKNLWDLPVRSEDALACMGWRSDQLPLRAGHSNSAPVTGKVNHGDIVGMNFVGDQGWEYLQVLTRDWEVVTAGWAKVEFSPDVCDGIIP
ncbi:DUF4453 domain-containing protein [Pseudophaeobacter arcticus]|jgi:hypothetical protein|uniref:DUF4453 domain-containing protein n=1 Tax=Pseudophaeobacter arcticus TaxID=385492 RepID=UPI0039E4676B